MAVKFSQFDGTITPVKTSETQFIVGFEGTTNAKWTMKALADEIGGGDNIYTADGLLQSFRTIDHNGYTLKWDLGSNSHLYENNSGSGTYINFRQSGAQRGAILNTSGGGSMYFRDSGGSDYYSVSQNGFYLNRNAGFGITAQANQRLTIKGAGTTNATTALLVEDGLGNDIIKALDDQSIGLGYNARQITTDSTSNGSVWLRNISGDPLFSAGIISGATGKINVYGGYYRTFEYGASTGLVFTNQAGFNVAQDASSMLTCVSSTKGFLPPRMTTTQRDAINSGTFTTGLTLYNTTDNKLQFYNGSAWTDAGGGGDNIYTADGTITSPTHRKITLAGTSAQPNKASLEISGAVRQGDFKVGNGYINNKWAWSWSMGASSTVATRHFYSASFYAGSNHETGAAAVAGVNYLSISAQGLEHHKVSIGIGVNGTTNDRLVIKGADVTSSKHSVRVLDNNDASMFSIRNDGAITLGKGATLFDEDGNGVQDVVIGNGATTDYASTYLSAQRRVAIGYQASVGAAGSVAVGAQASAGNTNCVAIGKSASVSGLNSVAVGSSATTSSGSSIALGTNASVSGGTGIAIGGTVATGNQSGITLGGAAGQKSLSVGIGSEAVTSAQAIGCKNTKATGTGATAMGPDMTVSGGNSMGFKSAPFSSSETTLSDSDTVAFYIDPGVSQTPNFSFNKTSTGNQASFAGQVSVGVGSGSNATIDFDTGNIQEITIPTETATNFTPTNAVAGSTYIIKITQAGTSGTMNWESSATVNWPGGTAPTLTATSAGVDIITLVCTAGGATGGTFYGTSALNFS